MPATHYPTTLPRSLNRRFTALQLADHFVGRERVDGPLGSYRSRLQAKINGTLPETSGPALEVDRRRNLSFREFVREYRDPGIPVVLEGAASHWDCCQRWSIERFRTEFGEDEVLLNDHSGDQDEGHSGDLDARVTTLGEALTALDPENYVRFYPLFQRHPETIEDIDLAWLRQRAGRFTFAEHFQVFVGAKGGHTPYHNAAAGNLFVQVEGEKEWSLIPPKQSAYLDPQCSYGISRGPTIAMNNEVYDRIPQYDLTLRPGDILWNPPFTWHTVTNKTDSLAVGYRWVSLTNAARCSPLFTFSDMTQMRPPLWKSAKLAKEELALVPLLIGIAEGKITDPELIAYAQRYRTKPEAEQQGAQKTRSWRARAVRSQS